MVAVKPYLPQIILLLLCIALRLPYLFISSNGYGTYNLTYHDETAFLYQGREIIDGFLPFERAWDNRAPLGWYFFSLFHLLSGQDLWKARLICLVLVYFNSILVWRIGSIHNLRVGLVSAVFYIVFSSILQTGQSLSYEHLFSFFLCWLILNTFRYDNVTSSLLSISIPYLICCHLMLNAVPLGFAIAAIVALKRSFFHQRFSVFFFLKNLIVVGISLVLLLAISFLCLIAFYKWHGLGDAYLTWLTEAQPFIAGKPMGLDFLRRLPESYFSFIKILFGHYATIHYWLVIALPIFFIFMFPLLFMWQPERRIFLTGLLLLVLISSLCMAIRGPFFPLHYLQFVPIVSLTSVAIVRDRMVMMLLAVFMVGFGSRSITQPVILQYVGIIESRFDGKGPSPYIFGDTRYQIADIINAEKNRNRYIYVCYEETELYILTGSYTPDYFIMPFLSTKIALRELLKIEDHSVWDRIRRMHPTFIVGPEWHHCFKELRDLLDAYYIKLSSVNGYYIYRKRKLTGD